MEKWQVRIQISLAWDQRPIDVRRIWSTGGQRTNSLWVCLGFCIHSKVDFGEKLSFEGYNKAEMKHTSDKKNIPRHEPWTQSSAKWDALTNVLLSQFSLLFWSYRSTFILLQCSLCKILLPSKFISSLGNWFNAFCCCPGKIKWSMTSHWMTSGHQEIYMYTEKYKNGPPEFARVLAIKPSHFVLLANSFIILSANNWNLDLKCKQQNLSGLVNYRDVREKGPWSHFRDTPREAKTRTCLCILINSTTTNTTRKLFVGWSHFTMSCTASE